MNKRATILALFASAFAILAPTSASSSEPKVLRLLTWEEYISPAVLAQFTRSTGVKIEPYYFNSDGERDALLVGQDGANYDLILVNGLAIDSYRRRGWIRTLDLQRIPNVKNVDTKWRQSFAGADTHAAPIFWGTLGIAYRADLVKTPITSWAQLLQPSKELCGRINMGGDARDVVGSVLKAVGASLRAPTLQDYRKVESLLRSQKPCVADYEFVGVSEDDPLVIGSVVAAMTYNGDAQRMREMAPGIRFVMPKEGGIIWTDFLAISSKSRAPQYAADLLNYLLAEEQLLKMATYAQYASASERVTRRLPAELRGNHDIVPTAAQLLNFEMDTDTDIQSARQRNRIFVAISR